MYRLRCGTGIYILAIPPPLGRDLLSKLKNREEFEGGLKKPEEFEETVMKVLKNREEFLQGEGNNFSYLLYL